MHDPLRAQLERVVDAEAASLRALSHAIHDDAEVGFAEHASSARVAEALAAGGLTVTHGACDLDTAVIATVGSGPLHVGICAEYDALPAIGHACGHNIIAAAAVGAARALATVADELGITVRVLGTPAEEGGGGKVLMLERGGFDGLHLAMMVHPAPADAATMPTLAAQQLEISYAGRAAHAAAHPASGLNAADALTVAQVALGLLRQQMPDGDRIHGIVTHGGEAPNVIPSRASGHWFVRAPTLERLEELEPRVRRCFEAGALATGTEVSFRAPGPAFAHLAADTDLVTHYVREAEAIGRRFDRTESSPFLGSTDMGNVSMVIPSIHPLIGIESAGATNHQPAFTAACVTPSADRAVRDGALALARTAVAVAGDVALRARLEARAYPDASDVASS